MGMCRWYYGSRFHQYGIFVGRKFINFQHFLYQWVTFSSILILAFWYMDTRYIKWKYGIQWYSHWVFLKFILRWVRPPPPASRSLVKRRLTVEDRRVEDRRSPCLPGQKSLTKHEVELTAIIYLHYTILFCKLIALFERWGFTKMQQEYQRITFCSM